jgi:hypothetical protein
MFFLCYEVFLTGRKNPKRLPSMPPTMWANSEILFILKAFIISFARKMRTTNIKVRGSSPCRILVKDIKRIIMKTIPLAPFNPAGKKKALSNPVTRAVINIIKSMEPEPYFSSKVGPRRRIKAIFPI